MSSQLDIWTVSEAAIATASAVVTSPFYKHSVDLSPDGRWLAYASNESDGYQVFVQPFPNADRDKVEISRRGGFNPRWRGDGRELFYVDRDGSMMAVDLERDGDVLTPKPPRALFPTAVRIPDPVLRQDHFFDVTPDGQQFLVSEPVPSGTTNGTRDEEGAVSDAEPQTINVLVNWSASLDAR